MNTLYKGDDDDDNDDDDNLFVESRRQLAIWQLSPPLLQCTFLISILSSTCIFLVSVLSVSETIIFNYII